MSVAGGVTRVQRRVLVEYGRASAESFAVYASQEVLVYADSDGEAHEVATRGESRHDRRSTLLSWQGEPTASVQIVTGS